MAQPLRRPLFKAVALSYSYPLPRRCLSSTPHLSFPASKPGTGKTAMLRGAQRSDPSLRVLSKSSGQVPQDLGLLDGTFITPTGTKRPSVFKSPKRFLKLQWTIFKMRLRDRLSLQILKFASPKEGTNWFKRKIKVTKKGVAAAATGLHRQMYTAFAEGDTNTLQKICTDGIREQLSLRISGREKGEKVTWELVKYKRRAKVVSDRAARLPIDGAAIRQAVVRIESVQKLTRTKIVKGRSGGETEVIVGGSGKERTTKEYVVVQKRTDGWVDGEWRVWGTTGENTLEDVEAWEKRLLG